MDQQGKHWLIYYTDYMNEECCHVKYSKLLISDEPITQKEAVEHMAKEMKTTTDRIDAMIMKPFRMENKEKKENNDSESENDQSITELSDVEN